MNDSNVAPIAYLTGEYPRATDTFIQREVAALRRLGQPVLTCSVRRTGSEHLVGPEQKLEESTTFYVLAAAMSPIHLIWCHIQTLVSGPGRYLAALGLALRSGAPGFRGLMYQLFYFAEAAVLAKHLRNNGVTHLHNHIAKSSCTLAMITSAMSGISYSFTLHGPDIFFAPERWRLDLKIQTAQFVACISHFCRSQAMAFSDPEHWDKLHIVHCGVEPERYEQERERQPSGNLLFVGRLAPVKGLPVLFEALASFGEDIGQWHLTIVGDGPSRADLENQALKLNLSASITFAGYQSQDAVADILSDTDILVLPSFAEGVPVVLMEAMAARTAVITTRIAGVPELVEDQKSGLLVAPGNASELANAIRQLLSAPDIAKAMGEVGREKVLAEFTLENDANWLMQLLQGYGKNSPPKTLRPAQHTLEDGTAK
jgi:glycosyltransferase involved in cell wall biosynthesis